MKPLTYLTLLIATSMTGLGAVFPDMVSVKVGQQVNAFQIGKAEVTWAKWKTVRDWAATQGYDISTAGLGSGEEHPVHSVSWYDAIKWLNAASELDCMTPVYKVTGQVYKSGQSIPTIDPNADGYRLPTEIEWEWAARGGLNAQGYTYSGSNTLADVGWYEANSSGAAVDMGGGHGTWPTRSKQPNELDLYDMSGNVAEWCWDADGSNRRFRGGNWWDNPAYCTVTFRGYAAPDAIPHSRGFRPVRNRLLKVDEIQYPVTRDWMEIEVPEPLANPDPDARRVINVVVINYLSSKDGTYVKQAKDFGVTDSSGQLVENLLISEMNKYMFVMNIQAKNCIEEGAKFRGFKNSDSKPYFGIKVIKCFNIYKEYYNYKAEHPDWEPDFFKAFDLIGVKDLVEKNGAKEVWWNSKVGVPESTMSTPLGPWGSGRADNSGKADDFLPIYNKTYVLYNGAWVHRTYAESIHCRGHQYEAQLAQLDPNFFWKTFCGGSRVDRPQSWLPPSMVSGSEGSNEDWRSDFLGWRVAEGEKTEASYQKYFDEWHGHINKDKPFDPQTTIQWMSDSFKGTGCGNCHFPPNANKDYAYNRSQYVNSNILDWSPDPSAPYTPINNTLWDFTLEIPAGELPKISQNSRWISESVTSLKDPQSCWLITWFQTIPSETPIIFNRNGATASQVENWWDIIFDWDEAISSGKKLYRTGLIQTISPLALIANKSYGANPFSVVIPTSTSNLPVKLRVKSGPAKITSNNTITLTGSGTVVLAANQAGDATYIAAEEVITSFEVTAVKTSQVIAVFNAIGDKVYGDAPFEVTTPASSSNLPVVLSVQSGPATVSGNIVTLTGSGSVVLAANQAGNANYNSAPEVTTSFHVTNLTPTPTPVITSSSSANGTMGVNFSYAISALNSPASFSAQGLPAGLKVNKKTGIISGKPTRAGVFTVNLSAENNFGDGTLTLTLTVAPPPPRVAISSISPIAKIDQFFSYQIVASNSPTSFNADGLPTGLDVNTSNGLISGTPTAAGHFNVTILASNDSGTGTAVLKLKVNPPPPVISLGDDLTVAPVRSPFSYQIMASNSPTIYGAKGLPTGLKINMKTGLISGKPTKAGVFSVQLTAKNASGSGSAFLTLTVQ